MIIVIENSDEELMLKIKQYAKEKQLPYYKIDGFFGVEQWTLLLQGIELALILAEPLIEQVFEKGTITIKDTDKMEDTAYHIIKYWDKNPEKLQKAQKYFQAGKLNIEGRIKFITTIEQKLKD